MDITKVQAYDDIWFDCKGNLYLSILQTIDRKYRNIALNNDYYYRNRLVETSSGEHTILETFTRWDIVGEMFANKVDVKYENDEQFMKEIKRLLDERKYVFVGVDLYYWIKENLCHGRDHWYHSTLIQKYDKDEDLFYVFDVNMDKTYGIFTIDSDSFLTSVKKGMEGGINTKWCEINLDVKIQDITRDMLLENTFERLNNLKEVKKSYYWKMEEIEYKKHAYEDLNSVHLGRIVQRLQANNMLFKELRNRGIIKGENSERIIGYTEELANDWLMIRYKVNMLYVQTNLDQKIKIINDRVQELFDKEMYVWDKFREELEELDNITIFKFN
ncbi:MAG: hypothetical protein IKS48_06710 [Eubacterium sp.]|nr:hypothetical protein [Eubacterium sp.]